MEQLDDKPRVGPGQNDLRTVRALLDGRFNVAFEDVRQVYLSALRHRVLLNFEAQAENLNADSLLQQILDAVPETIGRA